MRDTWNSKTAFVLAATGSAIGLGNIWRFPYVCYANGGGAFLIAYAICLFGAGIPLLMLEFSIGQRTSQSGPGAFGMFGKKLEWFGWTATGIAFVIVVYYAVVMSYCVNYTYQSINLGWGDKPADFFFNTFLGVTENASRLGTFRLPVLIGLLVSWAGIIACIWHGTKTVSKVIYITVIGPWLLLIIFVIRGITLEGAGAGIYFYLHPVWSKLADYRVWLDAITQVCFSLSVGFAVMIAYGSFLKRDADIVHSAFIIGIADACTAFISGFAIFGALGHKAFIEGVSVASVAKPGPGLAFVTYPEIINNLPFAQLFGLLFFIMLLLLAVDSAFSIVEAVATAVHDKWGWNHKRCNLTVGCLALVFALPLCFGGGIHILDIVDRFMTQMGITIVVLGECLIIGYYFGAPKMRDFMNKHSLRKAGKWWDICIKFIIPIGVLCMIIMELKERAHAPYGGTRALEFRYGWLVVVLIIATALLMTKIKTRKPRFEKSNPNG